MLNPDLPIRKANTVLHFMLHGVLDTAGKRWETLGFPHAAAHIANCRQTWLRKQKTPGFPGVLIGSEAQI
jgi:hypothetical protein